MKKIKILVSIIVAAIAVTGITIWGINNKSNKEIASATSKNIEKNQVNKQNEKSKTDIKYIYLDEHSDKNKKNITIKESINNFKEEENKKDLANNSTSSVVDAINNLNQDDNSVKVLSSTERNNKTKEIIDIINNKINNKSDNNSKKDNTKDNVKNNNTENNNTENNNDIDAKGKQTSNINNAKVKDVKEDNNTNKAEDNNVNVQDVREDNNTNKIQEQNSNNNDTINKVKEVIKSTKGKAIKEKPSFIVVDLSKTNKTDDISVKPTNGESNKTNNNNKDINNQIDDYPVLTADNIISLPYGSHWKLSDSNVKAYDKIDGDLHVRVAHIDIRAKVPGTYNVTLEAKNSRGKTTTKNIKVNILPEAPIIKAKDVTITQGTEFTDSLAKLKVTDCNRRDLTQMVKREGYVDINKTGTYPITYTVTDEYGLSCTKTIIVTVKEKDIQNEDLNKNLEISNNTAK